MNVQFTNPRHLYRAILRETTYLFDQRARKWSYEYATTAFRRHTLKSHDHERVVVVPLDPNGVPSHSERHLLKRGRKFLVLLQRANQGYQRQLRSILQLTYGRKGRIKRALIAPLMSPGLQPVLKSTNAAGKKEISREVQNQQLRAKLVEEWKAPNDFLSILNVQSQLSSYLSIRRQIRVKSPAKGKNKWGRPMPPSRVKNITRGWYAKMAAVLMPPIPEHEWERLKAIAARKQKFALIPRRPTGQRTFGASLTGDVDRAANTIVSGFEKSGGQKMRNSIKNPHNMTARFLSRFYARHILNHSPVAAPNPNGKGLVSKWDDGKRYVMAAEKPKDSTQLKALFG